MFSPGVLQQDAHPHYGPTAGEMTGGKNVFHGFQIGNGLTTFELIGHCIIGDAAYPAQPWLVKPFTDTGRLTEQ